MQQQRYETLTASAQQRQLPLGYQLNEYDVYCGRGSLCFNHVGNRRFRLYVAKNLYRYNNTNSKLEKSIIIQDVVDYVRSMSQIGGFVKRVGDTDVFYEVGDFLAREKTSQAFRDATKGTYKSSRLSRMKTKDDIVTADPFQLLFDYNSSHLCNTTSSNDWDRFCVQMKGMDNGVFLNDGGIMESEICNIRPVNTSQLTNLDMEKQSLHNPTYVSAIENSKPTFNHLNLVPINDQSGSESNNFSDNGQVVDTTENDARTFELLLTFTEQYQYHLPTTNCII